LICPIIASKIPVCSVYVIYVDWLCKHWGFYCKKEEC